MKEPLHLGEFVQLYENHSHQDLLDAAHVLVDRFLYRLNSENKARRVTAVKMPMFPVFEFKDNKLFFMVDIVEVEV